MDIANQGIANIFAAAHRRYDRQIPVEVETADIDPMTQLREDLKNKERAKDIIGAILNLLAEDDSDIEMVTLRAEHHTVGVLAILDRAMLRIARDRAV